MSAGLEPGIFVPTAEVNRADAVAAAEGLMMLKTQQSAWNNQAHAARKSRKGAARKSIASGSQPAFASSERSAFTPFKAAVSSSAASCSGRSTLGNSSAPMPSSRPASSTSTTVLSAPFQCPSCGTKKTPLQRSAQIGTKKIVLCNACGIRCNKHRIYCQTCYYVPKMEKRHEGCPRCRIHLKNAGRSAKRSSS